MRFPFLEPHQQIRILCNVLCQQARVAEAKEKREAKAEAKKKEGSLEKTEKVRTPGTE
jgi:hypothetical protein